MIEAIYVNGEEKKVGELVVCPGVHWWEPDTGWEVGTFVDRIEGTWECGPRQGVTLARHNLAGQYIRSFDLTITSLLPGRKAHGIRS